MVPCLRWGILYSVAGVAAKVRLGKCVGSETARNAPELHTFVFLKRRHCFVVCLTWTSSFPSVLCLPIPFLSCVHLMLSAMFGHRTIFFLLYCVSITLLFLSFIACWHLFNFKRLFPILLRFLEAHQAAIERINWIFVIPHCWSVSSGKRFKAAWAKILKDSVHIVFSPDIFHISCLS